MKKISIYCYHHPPHKGVGGRRWGEFGKRLAIRGNDVSVTVAPWSGDPPLNLIEGVKVRYLERSRWRRFPFRENRLSLRPLWIIQRLYWFFTGGGYADETDGLIDSIEEFVREDVRSGVDVIVVSCAPFHWGLHIGRELRRAPAMTRPMLAIDMRDPWSSNRIAYLNRASEWSRAREAKRELECLNLADLILAVENSVVLDSYQSSAKVEVLTNGAEMPQLKFQKEHVLNGEIRAVFVGSMYLGCIGAFVDFLIGMKQVTSALGLDFHCTIAGRWFKSDVEALAEFEFCNYRGVLSPAEVDEVWKHADLGLSIVPNEMTFTVNTKMLECFARQKPLILIGQIGEAGHFVDSNNLGFFWDSLKKKECSLALSDWIAKGIPIGPVKTLELYDLERLVDRLEVLFGSEYH